jgi:hypothetical protein
MIRNLKVLGLALVAVFAMSALIASTASAISQGKFTAKTYPAHIFASDTDDVFTVLGQELVCSHQTFTGVLAAASTDLTVTPEYTGCENKTNKKTATVTHNECVYTFTAGTVTSATDVHGTVDIVCPIGKEIEVHVYNNHAHTSLWCTLVIPTQAGLKVTYTNEATGHVRIEGTEGAGNPIEGITGTAKGECTAGLNVHFTTAKYDAGVTVEGTNGNEIDVG